MVTGVGVVEDSIFLIQSDLLDVGTHSGQAAHGGLQLSCVRHQDRGTRETLSIKR